MATFLSPLHLPLLLFLTLPMFTAAQTYRNISLGSSLTAVGPNTSWLSPLGDFAFGFLPVQPNNNTLFFLGIWFNKIPTKTVVWHVKASTPLRGGSKVELTTDGRLVLSDHDGNEVWAANKDATSVSHAAMLETGNFVLVATTSIGGFRWESFGNPTDTILPTQELGLGSQLISHLTDTDYSDGRFKFIAQLDGNLVLYIIAVPTGDQYSPYWATNTVGNGTRLIFNQTGDVKWALKDGRSVTVTSASVPTAEFYQRATLDPDGVFRQYVYPRNGTRGGTWSPGWTVSQQVPSNICTSTGGERGGSICGNNAYCTIDNQRPSCQCPTRYSFVDTSRKYKGCRADFVSPSCEGDALNTKYEMVQIPDTDWPLSDYEKFTNMDEDTCRSECLNDCFCAVAVFREGNCWKKKLPLTNGRMDNTVGGKALMKISRDNTTTTTVSTIQPSLTPNATASQKDKRKWILTGSLLLGISVFLIVVHVVLSLLVYFHRRKVLQPQHQQDLSLVGSSLRSFTYKELEAATEGFREELGRGAFGIVYKGNISSNSNLQIAVKKLSDLQQEAEKEFTNEVRAIGMTHHRNLVRLLGFCNEGPHRLLVYEFMSNGSLTCLLLGTIMPNWNQRTQIAYGIARGLLYLHEECDNQIIHCDIKPQNVLLDDCFTPKISDFGLAKLLRNEQTKTNTGIRGTRGYVAPEWFKRMPITAKVDVYSFGVMLLEIICCRKSVDLEFGESEKAILTDWAYDCYRDGRLDFLVDYNEEAIADMRRLEKFVMVALWCIQEEPALRPSMKKVIQMLEGGVEVSIPPDPSSFISSINPIN